MKSNGALQVIFAFFLGLVVTGFVAIGVSTFYPEPNWEQVGDDGYQSWRLVTSIILLVLATVLLVVSLTLPDDLTVISNGVLLGGVFTMLYAVGMTLSTTTSLYRFLVVAVALAVTIGIGYLRFTRRGRTGPAAAFPSGAGGVAGTLPPDAAARIDSLEHRLDALRRALDDPGR
ncbi:MAG TPA: hypothetical protein PLE12_01160 [Propionicimonas sp.]|jgi:hypothetical protein|nr:hypothetical protein [Propionicimonas sp.]